MPRRRGRRPVTSNDASAQEVERLFTEPYDRLMGILERGEEQIEARRAELAEVRYALYELTAHGGPPGRPGQVACSSRCGPRWPPRCSATCIEHTTDLSRVCTMVIDVGAGVEQENFRLNQDLLAEGRFRQRTIYPMDIMDTEAGRAWLRSFARRRGGAAALAGPAERVRHLRRALPGRRGRVGQPRVRLRRGARPHGHRCLHPAVRPRLRPRPSRGAGRGAGGRRPAAAQAPGAGPQGRVHRPLPRVQPAHRASTGGQPDGTARRADPLPARAGGSRAVVSAHPASAGNGSLSRYGPRANTTGPAA